VRSYVWTQWTVARWSHKQINPMLIYACCMSAKWKYGLLSHKKRVLLRKYQLMQPTYLSNIGLFHDMYSRYMFMKCKWWMTYGQGHFISNIGPGQNSALRVLCMDTMDSCPVVTQTNKPHANLCMLYTHIFFIFEHWFCCKYQYKKYIFNFIDHHKKYLSIFNIFCIGKSIAEACYIY
jgi:hypothetical protein